MNATRILLPALGLVCALQWTLPAFLIHRGQTTLQQGIQYRFRTAPIDPADPFRGRYVQLDFDAARVFPGNLDPELRRGQRVFAPIRVDDQGYAAFGALRQTPPDRGDYLQVEVLWNNAEELRLRLPFDRYYLDEHLAPEAERLYRESRRRDDPAAEEDPQRPAYVSVRVRDGYAVIEELYIDGQAVRTHLRELP
ncbi:MAG: GDYXXLXY domain-containing protein [Sinimarinibacterium sp.]